MPDDGLFVDNFYMVTDAIEEKELEEEQSTEGSSIGDDDAEYN